MTLQRSINTIHHNVCAISLEYSRVCALETTLASHMYVRTNGSADGTTLTQTTDGEPLARSLPLSFLLLSISCSLSLFSLALSLSLSPLPVSFFRRRRLSENERTRSLSAPLPTYVQLAPSPARSFVQTRRCIRMSGLRALKTVSSSSSQFRLQVLIRAFSDHSVFYTFRDQSTQ